MGLALTFITGIVLVLGPLNGPLERFSFDIPLSGHDTHSPTEALLVYLDQTSYQELGNDLNKPFSRLRHAQLITALQRDGAAVVVFDFLFHDPDPDPKADAALLEAMRRWPRHVVIGTLHSATEQGELKTMDPAEPLPAYRQAAVVGNAQLAYEGDRGVRRLPLTLETLDGPVPSLAAAALSLLTPKVPEVRSWYYLHYYGPPHRLPGIRYSDVLLGRVPPGYFRGKAVFVGARQSTSAAGVSGDMFVTPFTRDGRTGESPGVSLHATAFLNLLHHEWYSRAPGWVMGLLLLLFAGGAGAGLAFLTPLRAVLAAVLAAFLLVVAAFVIARTGHLWFPWAILLIVLAVGLSWSVSYNGARSHVEKQLLRQSLGLYLSPRRVEQILRHPEHLKPGGEMREVTVMFTDIAGFSKVAQRKRPEDLVKLLNGYYEQALSAVHDTDGMVLDLIGDAIFALWNAPELQPDHSASACRTALALHGKLLKFDESNDGAPLRTRVGLHRGPVCIGNVGGSQRFNYTAIGDAVNLAARLEGLNKHLGTDILATREVQFEVEQTLLTRLVGQFRFKGFDKVVEVYELIGPMTTEPAWFADFRSALRLFQRRAWDEAEAGFVRVLSVRPEDGPTKYYMGLLARHRAAPPPAEWLGEVDLGEK